MASKSWAIHSSIIHFGPWEIFRFGKSHTVPSKFPPPFLQVKYVFVLEKKIKKFTWFILGNFGILVLKCHVRAQCARGGCEKKGCGGRGLGCLGGGRISLFWVIFILYFCFLF